MNIKRTIGKNLALIALAGSMFYSPQNADAVDPAMKTSKKGIELITKYEGFSAKPYKEPNGNMAIGYGHQIKPGENFTTIDKDYAKKLLQDDLVNAENSVKKYIFPDLEQKEFDALVSFTYNLGGGNLQKSTLRDKVNLGDKIGASREFGKWTKSQGKVLNGLVKRRKAEREMYLANKIDIFLATK